MGCGEGTELRYFQPSQLAAFGGAACPTSPESKPCTDTLECPVSLVSLAVAWRGAPSLSLCRRLIAAAHGVLGAAVVRHVEAVLRASPTQWRQQLAMAERAVLPVPGPETAIPRAAL